MISNQNQFADTYGKKAFEVSYATLRVAESSGNSTFRSYLESYAMMLMDGIARGESGKVSEALQAIRQFSFLGVSAGFMNQKDADTLTHQSAILNSAISESGNSTLPDLNLEEIFSKNLDIRSSQSKTSSVQHPMGGRSSLGVEERQNRVLDRIRQSGNCRMKDLLDHLPGTSERTLRNDLHDLVAKRMIERVGTGGPAVYYQIPQLTASAEPIFLPPM